MRILRVDEAGRGPKISASAGSDHCDDLSDALGLAQRSTSHTNILIWKPARGRRAGESPPRAGAGGPGGAAGWPRAPTRHGLRQGAGVLTRDETCLPMKHVFGKVYVPVI